MSVRLLLRRHTARVMLNFAYPASKVMLNFAYLLHLAKIILYFVIFFGQDGCMLGSWLSLACILLQSAAALLVTAKSFFENFRLSYEW